MAKIYDSITDDPAEFIAAQQMFFVASAPLSATGHVNISPKGLDCFRILSPHRVAYLDLTGSGNETSAHLRENGRITFMFCAFAGPPRILRLYGVGTTTLPDSPEWAQLRPLFGFDDQPGVRQIITADISLVQTSCGFAVPLYDFVDQRDTLLKWGYAKGEDGVQTYRREKNTHSLDGLLTPLADMFAAE